MAEGDSLDWGIMNLCAFAPPVTAVANNATDKTIPRTLAIKLRMIVDSQTKVVLRISMRARDAKLNAIESGMRFVISISDF